MRRNRSVTFVEKKAAGAQQVFFPENLKLKRINVFHERYWPLEDSRFQVPLSGEINVLGQGGAEKMSDAEKRKASNTSKSGVLVQDLRDLSGTENSSMYGLCSR